jgi:Membrane bound O-acyl transferase family
LTVLAALLPPLVYYMALLLLAPPPPPAVHSLAVKTLRNVFALVAAILFFRLPLLYHVPQSIGLTYQLGLVGIYGGLRVLDALFISPYFFQHIPRRVKYEFQARQERHPHISLDEKEWSSGGVKDAFLVPDEPNGHVTTQATANHQHPVDRVGYSKGLKRRASVIQQANDFLSATLTGPHPRPVYETARTEETWPSGLTDRAAWALELELSMRGVGFTWTTADVRHTRETWLPTVHNRLHSIFFRAVPTLLVCWTMIRRIYVSHLQQYELLPWETRPTDLLDRELSIYEQLLLTAAMGAFLMAAFSLGHSMSAIILHPLSPSPLAFFPPLYTARAWEVTSLRKFWSYCWHRLFARLFLVWGVWPGEWLERKLTGKGVDESADIGKVLGAFASSAVVHSFSVRGVLGGDWRLASGEANFFCLNGIAVVLEGAVVGMVKRVRRQSNLPMSMWYDDWFGRLWWISALLWTGRNFARGWVTAELVREMAFM